jgi:UDP-glucuronate decarboxylase
VYGDPAQHPQTEGYWGHVNPIGPRACYDEGKRCAETLFADYRRQHGLDTRIARIFNTYGPRMQPADGRVVSNFIVAALRGEPLTIQGDGWQTRAFCYVTDTVDGLMRLMDLPGSCPGPVNIGNPAEFTVLELAERVRKLARSRSSIAFVPAALDDPRQRRPDISLAKKLLDWAPRVGLDEGLRLTIDYFRSTLLRGGQPGKRSTSASVHDAAGSR